MKDVHDIEKVPLLNEDLSEPVAQPQQPARCGFRRLKGLICVAAIYGVYALASRTLVHVGKPEHASAGEHHHRLHGHDQPFWPIKAFLEKQNVEELYLYVRSPYCAIPSAASNMLIVDAYTRIQLRT